MRSKLEVWVWSTLQTRGLSLECAPNSRIEFGVRSKHAVWVWSALQTRGLSLECPPNSRFEFGVRSKLEVWVWSALQTRGLSLECAPNSRFEFGVRSKLKVWVWSALQTRGLSLECALNSKLEVWVWSALQTRGLSSEHAPNSRFEFGVGARVRSKLVLQTQGLSLECAPNSGFSLQCPPNAGNDGLGARNKNQHACNHNRCFSFSGQQVRVNILAFWRFETGNCWCRFWSSFSWRFQPWLQLTLSVAKSQSKPLKSSTLVRIFKCFPGEPAQYCAVRVFVRAQTCETTCLFDLLVNCWETWQFWNW